MDTLSGMPTPVSDLLQYAQFVPAAPLTASDLELRLWKKQFQFIILDFVVRTAEDVECLNRCLTDRMRQIILENYRLAKSIDLPGPEESHREGRFYAWVPRQSGALDPDQSPLASPSLRGDR